MPNIVVVAHMNIQQLRYFCSVMQTGTFSGAARVEGVSVQAVSKALAALEEELGQPLFVRKSKGAVPTTFGRELHEHAQLALASFDKVIAFAQEQREHAGSKRETLSILLAVPMFNNFHAVCFGLERFLSRQLDMDVSFGLCYGGDAVPRLLAHELDVLITLGEYENPLCDSMLIGTLPTGVFVSESHPLAQRGEVTMADLAHYPVCYAIGLDDFNSTILRQYLAAGLSSPQIKIKTQEEFDAAIDREQAFALGVGMENFSTLKNGTMLKLAPGESVTVPVCAVTAHDYKSEGYRSFERFMLQEFSRLMSTFSVDN